ncbi:hypothetical protein H8D85_01370 [bacterium]|nr:hypothetical protein [bacterium]
MASLLDRVASLETSIENMATKSYVDLKVFSISDDMGTLLAEIEIIKEKLFNVRLPENSKYYLSQEEIDFIKSGMATVSKLTVDLENLRDSLIRTANLTL